MTTTSTIPQEYGKKTPQEYDKKTLEEAYARCGQITELFSKTFYLATTFMAEEQKKAVWAIYAWCRRTDDLVDGPRAKLNTETLLKDLEDWKNRTSSIWENEPSDVLDVALIDVRKNYPTLPIDPFLDMIEGMVMDTPLGQDRYQTWDELYLYCYRVASTVGVMTLPVMGTAEGYTEEQARDHAVNLGIALQITNILRDVGEDSRRGRIYLPKEDMDKFNVTESSILNGRVTPQYKELMKHLSQRARDYYKDAYLGVPMLSSKSRLGVQAAGDMYSGILDKLELNDYDNFQKRAFLSKPEKLVKLLGSIATVARMS
jgi:phytoene synthase